MGKGGASGKPSPSKPAPPPKADPIFAPNGYRKAPVVTHRGGGTSGGGWIKNPLTYEQQLTANNELDDRADRPRLAAVDSVFGQQFGDAWEQQQRDEYLSNYAPKIDSQFSEALGNLQLNLASNNPFQSSAGMGQEQALRAAYEKQKAGLGSQADDWVGQLRQRVESAKMQAQDQVDGGRTVKTTATAAADVAKNAAAGIQKPGFSELGSLFAGLTGKSFAGGPQTAGDAGVAVGGRNGGGGAAAARLARSTGRAGTKGVQNSVGGQSGSSGGRVSEV
jgi:hypothetical protein